MSRRALLLLPLALVGCGTDVPRPTWGRPGREGARLAVPLAVRVAVVPPTEALLPDAAARLFAGRLVGALQESDVPAAATDAPLPLDWSVAVRATVQGSAVRPTYELRDADGRGVGAAQGAAVPAREWAEARPETLQAAARDAAPRIAALLGTIQIARAGGGAPAGTSADERRVAVTAGRGAPGDGNAALPARLREALTAAGFVAQDTAEGAGFAVRPEVRVVPGSPGNQRVELQWVVSRRDGEELGRVVQLNEVPSGRLDRFWGDIAFAAAREAAGGVRQVIANAYAPPPAPRAAQTPAFAAPPAPR